MSRATSHVLLVLGCWKPRHGSPSTGRGEAGRGQIATGAVELGVESASHVCSSAQRSAVGVWKGWATRGGGGGSMQDGQTAHSGQQQGLEGRRRN